MCRSLEVKRVSTLKPVTSSVVRGMGGEGGKNRSHDWICKAGSGHKGPCMKDKGF